MKGIGHKSGIHAGLRIGCLIVVVCFAGGLVWPGLSFGDPAVSASVRLKQVYDSNILLEPEAESDFITIVTPEVKLEWPSGQSDFNLSYSPSRLQYWDNTEENATYHIFSALADLKVSRDWQVLLQDSFMQTTEPATTELTVRQERIRNDGSIIGRWEVNRTSFDLGYNNVINNYEDFNVLDRREDIFSFAGRYRYWPEASVFLQYEYSRLNYKGDDRSDGDYNQVWGGIEGKLSWEVIGSVKAGYQWRDYEQKLRDDFSGGVLYADLLRELTWMTTMSAFLSRRVEESSFVDNNYFLLNSGGLSLSHKFNEKLSLLLNGSYQVNKYSTEVELTKREDKIFQGGTGLRYKVNKTVSTGLSYYFQDRASNLDDFNYTDHRMEAEAVVEF